MTPKLAPIAQPGARLPSTPYARRLARERGIPLSALTGTGPNGRLTGRDVTGFVPTSESAPARGVSPAAATSLASPAALAATVSLDSILELLPQFDDVVPAIELVDVCLKATSAAKRGAPAALADATIALGSRPLAGLERLTLGAIAAMRQEAGAETIAHDGAALVVSWIDRAGLRPVAMPMPEGAVARLMIVGNTESNRAECLFSYDPARIDDTAAADFLLAFKVAMEIPLRLIA